MYIEVDQADLKYINSKLSSAKTNANKVLRNAINRTATVALKQIKAGRTKGYTISASRFNGEIKVQRANATHLDATITAKGSTHTLMHFRTTFPKKGGKANVAKEGLKKLVSSKGGAAFIPTAGQLSGIMAQRQSSSQYPLKAFQAPSTPKMVEQIWTGEHGGQTNLPNTVQERLHTEIMAEIAKII